MLAVGRSAVLVDTAWKHLDLHRLSCAGLTASSIDLVRPAGDPSGLFRGQVMNKLAHFFRSPNPSYRMGRFGMLEEIRVGRVLHPTPFMNISNDHTRIYGIYTNAFWSEFEWLLKHNTPAR